MGEVELQIPDPATGTLVSQLVEFPIPLACANLELNRNALPRLLFKELHTRVRPARCCDLSAVSPALGVDIGADANACYVDGFVAGTTGGSDP